MRSTHTKHINYPDELVTKLLTWAQQFREVIWLDSNLHNEKYSKFKAVLAVDAFTSLQTDYYDAFTKLNEYQSSTNDWIFGYLTYDLKNDVERLVSKNYDGLLFPDLYFFQPKRLFLFTDDSVEISYLRMVDDEMDQDWSDILSTELNSNIQAKHSEEPIKIKLRTSKDSYYSKINKMLEHIVRGDIYEANFCQEFYAEVDDLNVLKTYFHLNHISKPPFACFWKMGSHYAFSASPERYIQKKKQTIISQPIKGTAKRGYDEMNDKEILERLRANPKERSENIMITDLVRNDLSKIAEKGTVTVEELCAIYTFEQVHQMISTVSCEVDSSLPPVEIIKATFPMGSMTGAPKIRAMQIIEELEDAKRGLYSGAIGYFDPNSDFDFNVIIRSILYNEMGKYVSYSVGGAITAQSTAEGEYEECLIKAKAMREALEH